MFRLLRIRYSSKELKDSIVGTAKSIAKDAKKVTAVASETLKDDFNSIGQAVASASERIDQTVRATDQERFHAAEEAGKRAEAEDKKFVFSEQAENPINKASKMAHEVKETVKEKVGDAKETIKDKIEGAKENIQEKTGNAKEAAESAFEKSKAAAIRAQHSNQGYSEPRESMGQKMEQMAENVIGKVKETVASVKDTLTGSSTEASTNPSKYNPPTIPSLDNAKINPMGGTPSDSDPLLKPQTPLSPQTEELQKKGAERKAEEDPFNLM